MITDVVDTAIYNTFDDPSRAYEKRLKKEREEKKRDLHKIQYEFLNQELKFPDLDKRGLSLTLDLLNYPSQLEVVYYKYLEITEVKLRAEKMLLDSFGIIDNLEPSKVAQTIVSTSPNNVWSILLLIAIVCNVLFFSWYLLIGSIFILFLYLGIAQNKLTKEIEEKLEIRKEEIYSLGEMVEEIEFHLNFDLSEKVSEKYNQLLDTFHTVSKTEKIWDILSSTANEDPSNYARREVAFSTSTPAGIRTNIDCIHMSNYDGDDLFLFPYFILAFGEEDIKVIDYMDLSVSASEIIMMENNLPLSKDAEVLKYRWEYEKKNGEPDMRYNNNRELPMVKYYKLDIYVEKYTSETYLFSNRSKVENFVKSLEEYKKLGNGFR